MRVILILVAISVFAAMAIGFLDVKRHLWSKEVFFEDFEDNNARLVYLRGQGFFPASDCAPEVAALEFVEGDDRWMTVVLSAGEGECYADADTVLPLVSQEDGWSECLQRQEEEDRYRYTCFGK